MTIQLDIPTLIQGAIVNALSGLVQNVFYIIIFIWAVRTLVKQVPKWIEKYEKVKINERAIEMARRSMSVLSDT
jgi:hypothetical protein